MSFNVNDKNSTLPIGKIEVISLWQHLITDSVEYSKFLRDPKCIRKTKHKKIQETIRQLFSLIMGIYARRVKRQRSIVLDV